MGDGESLLGQAGELLKHRRQNFQQRLDDRPYGRIVAGELAHSSLEGGATRPSKLEAGLAQHGPHDVLDCPPLVEERPAGDQERTPQPGLAALHS